MTDDKTGWSEKGKRSSGSGDRKSSTPSRPSKRAASTSSEAAESSVVRTPASSDAGARKVAKAAATAGQRDVAFASRMGFPALVALICLLGIGAVVYARSTREALATPAENRDHWHAVYGLYSCNIAGDDPEAKFLPAFQSSIDASGIHSHGDGLMHIHPFVAAASGDNAQMRHWFTEMQVTFDEERVSVQNQFDPPAELVAGEQCADGTGTAEIKVLYWEYDFQALADPRVEPQVITSDFGQIKFDHDREVFLLAYVSEDTPIEDIPIPPRDRFNTLDNVSADLEYDPTTLNPVDTGVDTDGDDASSDDAESTETEAEGDE